MRSLLRTGARGALAIVPAALLALVPHTAGAQRGPNQRIMFRSDVPQSEHRIAAPPERVAEALQQAYAYLGIPLTRSTEDRNDLFTPYMQVRGKMYNYPPSTFFQCQDAITGNMADTGELTLAILNQMRPTRDGITILLMQMDASIRRRDTSTGRVPCTTTGKFEQAVIGLVEQRLFPDPPIVAQDSTAAAQP